MTVLMDSINDGSVSSVALRNSHLCELVANRMAVRPAILFDWVSNGMPYARCKRHNHQASTVLEHVCWLISSIYADMPKRKKNGQPGSTHTPGMGGGGRHDPFS